MTEREVESLLMILGIWDFKIIQSPFNGEELARHNYFDNVNKSLSIKIRIDEEPSYILFDGFTWDGKSEIELLSSKIEEWVHKNLGDILLQECPERLILNKTMFEITSQIPVSKDTDDKVAKRKQISEQLLKATKKSEEKIAEFA